MNNEPLLLTRIFWSQRKWCYRGNLNIMTQAFMMSSSSPSPNRRERGSWAKESTRVAINSCIYCIGQNWCHPSCSLFILKVCSEGLRVTALLPHEVTERPAIFKYSMLRASLTKMAKYRTNITNNCREGQTRTNLHRFSIWGRTVLKVLRKIVRCS